MFIRDLTDEDCLTIKQCLDAVASGEMIPDDWEFSTLYGIEFSEFRSVAEAWPDVDDSDELIRAVVTNSLGNLIGYPHGKESLWPKYISSSPSAVHQLLRKWTGENSSGHANAELGVKDQK